MFFLSLIYFLSFSVQESNTSSPEDASPGSAITAESLRKDIGEMRRNLLLGGEQVQRAEGEAINFYGSKIELIDQRLDTVHADLSEKRAEYNLLLERMLVDTNDKISPQVMQKADALRREIGDLEQEIIELEGKRATLSKLVSAVESRDRERQGLMAQLETSEDFQAYLDVPFSSGIGLAPERLNEAPASPLKNSDLVDDLMERDPLAARRLLFQADPQGYFERFPLQPPADILRGTLVLPLPDLPGQR